MLCAKRNRTLKKKSVRKSKPSKCTEEPETQIDFICLRCRDTINQLNMKIDLLSESDPTMLSSQRWDLCPRRLHKCLSFNTLTLNYYIIVNKSSCDTEVQPQLKSIFWLFKFTFIDWIWILHWCLFGQSKCFNIQMQSVEIFEMTDLWTEWIKFQSIALSVERVCPEQLQYARLRRCSWRLD